MTRTVAANMLTSLGQVAGTEVSLIEFQFGSGTTRVCTGATNVSWNSQTWTAIGGALSVPELADTTDDLGQGIPIELSGVDQALLAIILGETYRGRLCKVWHAKIDPTAGTVVADPLLMFSGYMNGAFSVSETRPEQGGGTVSISTRVTSRFAEFTQPHGYRCNVESHSKVLADLGLITGGDRDTFFSTVAGLPGRKIYWGTKAPLDLTNVAPAGPPSRPTTPGSGGGTTAFGGGSVMGGSGTTDPWGLGTRNQQPVTPGGGGGPSTGRLP